MKLKSTEGDQNKWRIMHYSWMEVIKMLKFDSSQIRPKFIMILIKILLIFMESNRHALNFHGHE